MPLFLMLSGFTLTVVYGRDYYEAVGLCCEAETDDHTEQDPLVLDAPGENIEVKLEVKKFEILRFYQNRVARVMPVYYLTMLIAIPATMAGFGVVAPSDVLQDILVANVIPICTVTSYFAGAPLDGPAWTVATLLFFWLFFPYFLTKAQRLKDAEILSNMVSCFYWQAIVAILSFFAVISVYDNLFVAFGTATMNPITRFPLFQMGVYAGVLTIRHAACTGKGDNHKTLDEEAGISNEKSIFPWPKSYLSFFPHCCCGYEVNLQDKIVEDNWLNITHNTSIILLAITVTFSAIDIFLYKLFGALFLQAVVPFAQLTVIVGLTRNSDQENNIAYRLLTTPLALWLGKLSMTIYLVHWILICYMTWIIYGHSLTWCNMFDKDADCDDFLEARLMPVWAIPVVIAASLLLSTIIFYGFEEPCRKLLQSKKSR